MGDFLALYQDVLNLLWPDYPVYSFSMLFNPNSGFKNDLTKSFFTLINDSNSLIWIRLGIFIAMTIINYVTMYLTDWHNDEYCWYLTNQSQWMSWLSSFALLITSLLKYKPLGLANTLNFDTIPVVSSLIPSMFHTGLSS
jgi:hypothetical protein